MVDEELDECVEVDIELWLSHGRERAVTHLVTHVLDLLLRGVVSHSSHKVSKLVNWYLAFELASLGRVLFLRSDHGVVEEIVDILICLTLSTAFNQLDERFNAIASHSDGLLNRADIDSPHVDCEVSTSASEDILAVG